MGVKLGSDDGDTLGLDDGIFVGLRVGAGVVGCGVGARFGQTLPQKSFCLFPTKHSIFWHEQQFPCLDPSKQSKFPAPHSFPSWTQLVLLFSTHGCCGAALAINDGCDDIPELGFKEVWFEGADVARLDVDDG